MWQLPKIIAYLGLIGPRLDLLTIDAASTKNTFVHTITLNENLLLHPVEPPPTTTETDTHNLPPLVIPVGRGNLSRNEPIYLTPLRPALDLVASHPHPQIDLRFDIESCQAFTHPHTIV